MTTNGEPDVLVDTSVAVPLSLESHDQHEAAMAALDGRRLGLSGHAAFETFAVLTRLPPPARRSPRVVSDVIAANFPSTRHLSPGGATALIDLFARGEIAGGAVYDALVGAAAREHGHTLVTLDERALTTYRVLGVDVEVLQG